MNINITSRVFNVKNKSAFSLVKTPGFLWALQIPWHSMTFSMTLVLAVTFKVFKTILVFGMIFSTCLFNNLSLSYFGICSNQSTEHYFSFPRLSRFSMNCTNPATHVLISSDKGMRQCGLTFGASTPNFPEWVCILKEKTHWTLS